MIISTATAGFIYLNGLIYLIGWATAGPVRIIKIENDIPEDYTTLPELTQQNTTQQDIINIEDDELHIHNSVPTGIQNESEKHIDRPRKILVNDLTDMESDSSNTHDIKIGTRYQVIDSKLNLESIDDKLVINEFTVSTIKPATNPVETKSSSFAPIEQVVGFTTNRDNLLVITTLTDDDVTSSMSKSSSTNGNKIFAVESIDTLPSLVSQQVPDIFMERQTTQMIRLASQMQTEATPIKVTDIEPKMEQPTIISNQTEPIISKDVTQMVQLTSQMQTEATLIKVTDVEQKMGQPTIIINSTEPIISKDVTYTQNFVTELRPSLAIQQVPIVTTSSFRQVPIVTTSSYGLSSNNYTGEHILDVTTSVPTTSFINPIKPSLISQQMPFLTTRPEMAQSTTELIRTSIMASTESIPEKTHSTAMPMTTEITVAPTIIGLMTEIISTTSSPAVDDAKTSTNESALDTHMTKTNAVDVPVTPITSTIFSQVITEPMNKIKPSLVLQQLPDISNTSTISRITPNLDVTEAMMTTQEIPNTNTDSKIADTTASPIVNPSMDSISKEIISTNIPSLSSINDVSSKIVTEANDSRTPADIINESPVAPIVFPKPDNSPNTAVVPTVSPTWSPITTIVGSPNNNQSPLPAVIFPKTDVGSDTNAPVWVAVPINDQTNTISVVNVNQPVSTMTVVTMQPPISATTIMPLEVTTNVVINSDVKPTALDSLPDSAVASGSDSVTPLKENSVTDMPPITVSPPNSNNIDTTVKAEITTVEPAKDDSQVTTSANTDATTIKSEPITVKEVITTAMPTSSTRVMTPLTTMPSQSSTTLEKVILVASQDTSNLMPSTALPKSELSLITTMSAITTSKDTVVEIIQSVLNDTKVSGIASTMTMNNISATMTEQIVLPTVAMPAETTTFSPAVVDTTLSTIVVTPLSTIIPTTQPIATTSPPTQLPQNMITNSLTTTMVSSNQTERPMHLESQQAPAKGSAATLNIYTSVLLSIISLCYLHIL